MITLTELKTNYLNVSGSAYDTQLQLIIDAAVKQLEQYCQQNLLSVSLTKEAIVYYGRDIDIDGIWGVPLTVTLVQEKANITDAYTTISSSDYATYTDGKTYKVIFTRDTERYVKITYTQGYTTSNAPSALKQAVGNLALEMYKASFMESSVNTFGVESVSTNTPAGTTTVKYVPLMNTVKQYVSDWRIARI